MLLHVNLLLEVESIAHLHELMGIAGIAVLAGKLASPIRIDRPGERHPGYVAAIQKGANWQGEVLHLMPLAQELAIRSQASDAHESGTGFGKQGKAGHLLTLSCFVRLI